MCYNVLSPSSRRAWIEIIFCFGPVCGKVVALLAEGVDRNCTREWYIYLQKRSPSSRRAWIEMERFCAISHTVVVALLAEGVDRNSGWHPERHLLSGSPSSRRAWIEIRIFTESPPRLSRSPSSRRAWIEMPHDDAPRPRQRVALLAEGVDRNNIRLQPFGIYVRRPPRGGRG